MKLAFLAFIIFLIATAPKLEGNIDINVEPKKPERSTPRRDTTPRREPHVTMALNVVETPKRLMYVFIDKSGIRIENVNWMKAFGNLDGKTFYGRISRVDADGYTKQVLFSGVLQHDFMHITLDHYSDYRIAVFEKGGYCNGIEYDFKWFGSFDCTPIKDFVHHQIPCE
jgi:hypothetical protein